MKFRKVAYGAVKAGDKIYDHNYFAYCKLREVTEVSEKNGLVTLKVGVTAHPTIDTRTCFCGHSAEGISIYR